MTNFAIRWTAHYQGDEQRRLKDPDGWQLIQDSNDALKQKLVKEIAEYEALVTHDSNEPIKLECESIDEISDLLIEARIAFKITQQELAELCNRTYEQIKSFEDKDYQNASLTDFWVIADALGVEISNGKFVAQMHEFYLKRLSIMRQTDTFNQLQVAS